MFKKIFALALILVFVALCARRPLDGRLSDRLPNTCNAAQFAAMVDAFDDIATERYGALARVEVLRPEEPVEYVRNWQREQEVLKELALRADGVRAPRCLTHAKDLFEQYLAQTLRALDKRSPEQDFTDYRHALETTEGLYTQYRAELRLQEKNRE
jgi:hypothetical protein